MQNGSPTYVNVQTLNGRELPPQSWVFNSMARINTCRGMVWAAHARVQQCMERVSTAFRANVHGLRERPLMQLWVRPTSNVAGRQDVISDTYPVRHFYFGYGYVGTRLRPRQSVCPPSKVTVT